MRRCGRCPGGAGRGATPLGALLLAAPLLVACSFGRAQTVQRDAYGGVLTLQGIRSHAWEDAEQQMITHCGPGNYEVVSEEQVVVGQETHTTGGAEEEQEEGRRRTETSERYTETTTTRDITEYRVTYQCGGGPATAGGSAAPPPAGEKAEPVVQPAAQPGPGAEPIAEGEPTPKE